jgi:hypothetical protein
MIVRSKKRAFILGGVLLASFFYVASLRAQIVNIEDSRVRMADSVHWLGFVDLGGNVNKNVQYVYAARAALQVEYKNKRHFFLSISQYNLLKTEGKNILNDGMQHLRYNFALKPVLNLEVFSQIQYNERISLRQRELLGAGLRYRIWKLRAGRAYVGAAYMYEQSNWTGDSEQR